MYNDKLICVYKGFIKMTLFIAIMAVASQFSCSIAFNVARDSQTKSLQDINTNFDDKILSMPFDSYDYRVLTGTQVQSAYKLFEDRVLAIVINTNDYKRLDSKAKSKYDTLLGVNYNALIDTDSIEDKHSYYKASIKNNKDIQYNKNSEDEFKLQKIVRPNARFLSKLIKDDTGEVIGIYFEEDGWKIESK